MRYHCGHEGCDICGTRTCGGERLRHIGDIWTCESCLLKALRLAIHVAESFSTYIDLDKPCGNLKRTQS